MYLDNVDKILFSENYGNVVKSDYAILCGTSPEYAPVRAEIAASFYKKGGTASIVASGAAVADKSITESAVLKQELLKRGVPEEAVIEESQAFDTIQNMTCSLTEICKRTDIMLVESITVITEPYHMKRALSLARILLPEHIKIYGYTQGAEYQREAWLTDERLKKCVENEMEILKQLAEKGRVRL